ncbi:F-box domain-containing protein [Mycena chlorophos]|uniref:F-box domain-containing protein n=1 Tax=Mycena chlorophos TaxID=658473 RepID=A0A8H6VQK1_MYCCL|nr:F-box domain-containing protein [Mycena chlorophos]
MDPALAPLLGQPADTSLETHARMLLTTAQANFAQLEAQIQDLVLQREKERASIAFLKFVVAPVRKLPTEILTEILLTAAAIADYTTTKRSKGGIRARLTLSHVSTLWRAVSQQTPRLWVMELPINVCGKPEYASMTKELLSRSHPFPINIVIDNTPHGRSSSFASERVLDAVVSVAERWLTLKAVGVDPFSALARLNELPVMPHLTEVTFDHISPRERDYNLAFLRAPLLHVARITRAYNIQHLQLPWTQLTALELNGHFGEDTLAVLHQCTNLEEAEIECYGWKTPPPATNLPSPLVIFANLTALSVALKVDNDFARHPFFSQLSLPALAVLKLEFHAKFNWGDAMVTTLSQFFTRASALKTLEIREATFEPDQLITLLGGLSVLRKLIMYSCEHCFQDELIERLTYDASRGSETILPCLGNLTIQHAGDDFDDDLLADMIESRWNVTSPATSPGLLARLRSVDIHAGSYQYGDTTRKLGESAELQARMEVLRKEGMRVYLI